MTPQKLKEFFVPSTTQLKAQKNNGRPNHFRTAQAFVFAGVLGGFCGASLAGWWLLRTLSKIGVADVTPTTVKVFTEISEKSLIVALGAGGILLFAVTCEVYGSVKALKRARIVQATAPTAS